MGQSKFTNFPSHHQIHILLLNLLSGLRASRSSKVDQKRYLGTIFFSLLSISTQSPSSCDITTLFQLLGLAIICQALS